MKKRRKSTKMEYACKPRMKTIFHELILIIKKFKTHKRESRHNCLISKERETPKPIYFQLFQYYVLSWIVTWSLVMWNGIEWLQDQKTCASCIPSSKSVGVYKTCLLLFEIEWVSIFIYNTWIYLCSSSLGSKKKSHIAKVNLT